MTVVLAVLVLVLPGAALGVAVGVRGRLLWGVAPALTLGFTGLAALGYAKLGISWAPLSVAVGVAVASAVLAGVTWAVRTRWPGLYPPEPARVGRTAVNTAMAAGAAITVTVMLIGTRSLTRIPQAWDSIFHGSASRLIEVTGNASPFALADASAPADAAYYYPDAFHALTALVLRLPGQSMPDALNGMVTATGVAFILAIVALMQRIDARPLALSAAAVAAASFCAFPIMAASHGPLSPFGLAAASMPGVLAVLFALLRRPGLPAVFAAGLGMSGIYVTHPSVAAAMMIVVALAGLSWLCWAGSWASRGFWARLLAVAAAGVLAAALTIPSIDTAATGVMSGFDWPATHTIPDAVVRVLGFQTYVSAQWLLSALALLGLWGLIRRREMRPLVLGAIVLGWLCVLAWASDAPYVQTLTSLWWNDGWRFLALYTVLLVPVAAYGVVVLVGLITRVSGALNAKVVGAVTVLALVAVSAAVYAPRGTELLARTFGEGGVVYPGEARAYAELAEIYDGGAVMNDPFDGSPWLFTLESVPVLLPSPLGGDPVGQMGQDRMDMYADLHSYGHNPYMDEIVERLDVRWVVVGEGSVGEGLVGGKDRAPGFVGLAQNPRFEPVISNADVVIYRVRR